jgi:hypothetical protein
LLNLVIAWAVTFKEWVVTQNYLQARHCSTGSSLFIVTAVDLCPRCRGVANVQLIRRYAAMSLVPVIVNSIDKPQLSLLE